MRGQRGWIFSGRMWILVSWGVLPTSSYAKFSSVITRSGYTFHLLALYTPSHVIPNNNLSNLQTYPQHQSTLYPTFLTDY
jgi:hypothetical protein